ncbi:MAG: hypothetical protein K6F82_05505 [Sphaerochaetaceae bacterium]|nr:hypothetical protein [Sphaerochaetaceae bacterium]
MKKFLPVLFLVILVLVSCCHPKAVEEKCTISFKVSENRSDLDVELPSSFEVTVPYTLTVPEAPALRAGNAAFVSWMINGVNVESGSTVEITEDTELTALYIDIYY